MRPSTRRRFLGGIVGGTAALSGCLGGGSLTGGGEVDLSGEEPPTVDRSLPEAYTLEELEDNLQSGGPGKDGIPSIDEPRFAPTDSPPANLDGDDPVFGVELDGEAKAYPQYVLVWHEVVNDVVGGQPVAVTYCPLTGTAQGFHRGPVEFGVSGSLINTNLVMYDRGTDTWWPQMLARGIDGPLEGAYLEEFQVVWTTWKRWQRTHPETVVLTENTDHARDYGSDPYGAYNPKRGYYSNGNTLFPPLRRDDRFHPKSVVLGARNRDGATAVPKATLREEAVVDGETGSVPFVAVYDPDLDTGYLYRNPEGRRIADAGDGYSVDGTVHPPGSLPLERQIAYGAMWFAWFGYYPSTEVYE